MASPRVEGLLDEAGAEFASAGFDNGSLRKIMRQAGVDPGAIYAGPADFVATTVASHFAPVADAFRPHLEAALPHVTFDDIAWRIRWCVFGPVGALLTDESAAFARPADDLVEELARTLSAALAA